MGCSLKLWLVLSVAFSYTSLVRCQIDWTYEIRDIEADNKTPDILEMKYNLNLQNSRSFGITGNIQIKEDLTDDLLINIKFYYSPTGSYYVPTSPRIKQMTLSEFLNTLYKDYIMENCRTCMENAPEVHEKFVGPLTKRVVNVRACHISQENMPMQIKPGFYKIVMKYTNQAEGSMKLIVKVKSAF